MNIVLYFILIYINAIFIAFFLHRGLNLCIPLSLFMIMFFGYICALLGLLCPSVWILIGIVLIELIVLIVLNYKNKVDLKKYIYCPSSLYMLVIMIITVFLFRNSYVDKWDELVQWAIYAKNMYLHNKLFDPSFTSVTNAYPPLITITQYTVCKLGNAFSEADLHRVSYFVAVLPLAVLFKNNYKSKLRLASIIALSAFFPLLFFSTFLRSSYVDMIIAMLAGFMIIVLIEDDINCFNLVLFFITGCVLTATKEFGFVITGILYMTVLLDMFVFRRKQYFDLIKTIWIKNKIKFIFVLFMAISPILVHYFWVYYSATFLMVEAHETSMSINNWASTTISNYLLAIFYTPVLSANKIFKFSTIIWLLVYITILLTTMFNSDKQWKKRVLFVITSIVIIYVLYNVAQLAAYLLMFSETEAIALSSYERYLRILLLMLAVITYYTILPHLINKDSKSFWIYLLACALLMNPKPIITTAKLAISDTEDKENFERRFYYCNDLNSSLNADDRVYYIDQNMDYRGYDGYNYWVVRYKITPIKVQDYNWSILVNGKLSDEDVWTTNMSVEEWKTKLDEFDYVYLAVVSDQFKKDYSSLFESKISNYTLYKVVYSNNALRLTEAY